jgi:hypothetical protein
MLDTGSSLEPPESRLPLATMTRERGALLWTSRLVSRSRTEASEPADCLGVAAR